MLHQRTDVQCRKECRWRREVTPYVLAIAAAALTLSTAADGARAKGGGGGGSGTPEPTAAFTISSPSQSPTSIAAGQTVALRFNVKSAQAASNVDVYVVVPRSEPDGTA